MVVLLLVLVLLVVLVVVLVVVLLQYVGLCVPAAQGGGAAGVPRAGGAVPARRGACRTLARLRSRGRAR